MLPIRRFCAGLRRSALALVPGLLLAGACVADDGSWSTVMVGVADLDAAHALWVDTFGFDVVRERVGPDPDLADLLDIHPDDIARQSLVRSGDAETGMVHFIEWTEPGAAVREGASAYDHCPKNLDVYVDDMAERFTELRAAGYRFRNETFSDVTAPDGTRFQEAHMPVHDDINVVLLKVFGRDPGYTSRGFAGIGPLIAIVPDAAADKRFAKTVLRLYKRHDNVLEGPEIEEMVGLPPGTALDVSIWGAPDNRLGQLEFIEYRGVVGANLYSRVEPGARGVLYVTYETEDVDGLRSRLDATGTAYEKHERLELLHDAGDVLAFETPGGLRLYVLGPSDGA